MKIIYYIIKRLIWLIPVLLGISIITFFVSRILPGNPVYLILGSQANEEMVAELTSQMGLDKPMVEQYVVYLSGILHGDLGTAWHTNNPVLEDLTIRFPATLELIMVGLFMALLVAIPLGVVAAIHKDGPLDHMTRGISMIGVTIPEFFLGLLLIFFFFYKMRIFPAPMGRMPFDMTIKNVTGLRILDGILTGNGPGTVAAIRQIFLPSFTLAFVSLAPLTRLIRSSMISVMNSEYIVLNRASGLKTRDINYKYALKNALLPAITMLGTMFGYMLGGAVLVEKIFAWPGVGLYAVDSIQLMDYSAVQGFVLLSAVFYVMVFLVIDLIYFAVDPRIKY